MALLQQHHSSPRALATRQQILIFTKYPTPGFAKTRLIPSEGPQGAAVISRQLTQHCVATVRNFLASNDALSIIYFTANESITAQQMRQWLHYPENDTIRNHELIQPQSSGDLGQRMSAAFSTSFQNAAEKVLIIGTDIPEIDEHLLAEAFAKLDHFDLVIGPAADGGYYLLAMKTFHPELFTNIQWSTDKVCSATLAKAQALNLCTHKLRILRDIDLPEDVPYLRQVFAKKQA